MRALSQHWSLCGHRLMGEGAHCIRERRMEEPSTKVHTHIHTPVSHKHKLPASTNSSSCMSHLCDRLNRNERLIWPGAEPWQETLGDPRTDVTTVERGTLLLCFSADLRATSGKRYSWGLDAGGLSNKVVLFLLLWHYSGLYSELRNPSVNL